MAQIRKLKTPRYSTLDEVNHSAFVKGKLFLKISYWFDKRTNAKLRQWKRRNKLGENGKDWVKIGGHIYISERFKKSLLSS